MASLLVSSLSGDQCLREFNRLLLEYGPADGVESGGALQRTEPERVLAELVAGARARKEREAEEHRSQAAARLQQQVAGNDSR